MLSNTFHPQLLKEYQKAVVSVKYSSDGDLIAIACADKRAQIYNSSDGQLQCSFDRLGDCHTAGLNDCTWLTDSLVVTASDDGTVKVWDVQNAQAVSTFKAPKNTFVHSLCVDRASKLIYGGTFDGQVCCFAAHAPDAVAVFRAHGDAVISMQMRGGGGGGEAAAMQQQLMTGGQESVVRLWDARNVGLCTHTIVISDVKDGTRTPLSCASCSSNGQLLLTSTLDHTHRLFDLSPLRSSSAKSLSAESLRFRGHVNDRYCIPSLLLHKEHLAAAPAAAAAITGTTATAAVISGSEDGGIYVWPLHEPKEEATHCIAAAHEGTVLALDVHPSASQLQLVSGSADGALKLWTAQTATD